ncbi:hypothetical protein ACSBM8_13480 [Sphingomonas sp. ASY06-1R]|uniref:hypothetical protein n=1 Tax=Sphingomonas sp. ASY06-1R TaxID=3445771 RepID=UPI003FA221DE
MPRSRVRLGLQVAATIAASAMAVTTVMPAAAASTATKGVDGLARLSAADLDTTRPPGRAFLKTLFPDPAKTCERPTSQHLPFDTLCNWFAKPDSDDVFPDLMIAMNKARIVSVVTVEPKRLNPNIWTCEKADPGRIAVCTAKAVDAATRQRWSQAWHTLLNSVN